LSFTDDFISGTFTLSHANETVAILDKSSDEILASLSSVKTTTK